MASRAMAGLPWVYGPTKIRISGNSEFTVPKGYELLSPPHGKRFLALIGNLVDESDADSYIVQPEAQDKSWFMEFQYIDSGHVTDDEKIDADELLKSMRDHSSEENRRRRAAHLSGLTLMGWQLSPQYSKQLNRLEWAYKFRDDEGALLTNLNTRVLTRTGYYRVMLVADSSSFVEDRNEFNTLLNNLTANAGNQYTDYKSGDRIARYGLMGLIGGGVAAAAIKTGVAGVILAFLAKFMTAIGAKGILVAIAGFAALAWSKFKSLFSRKKED